VAGTANVAGYFPSTLGQDNLGWESTASTNIGLDFGILNNRITGDINLYEANTSDLLLKRAISPLSGYNSITQNIGKTNNKGLEISVNSKNIDVSGFTWTTDGSISFNKNKIVALYGLRDSTGKLTDDLANNWFIGQPVKVNYDYVFNGIWQLGEEAAALKYGCQPGWRKYLDINGDSAITASQDRKIIGQTDPKFTWGLTNTFSFKGVTISAFFYGVHGVTRPNLLRRDPVGKDARTNGAVLDWWSPTNPSNTMNIALYAADAVSGGPTQIYEDASFTRLKELTLSYDLPARWLERIKMNRLRIYFTGRNLMTFTKFGGMDPELGDGTYNPSGNSISDTPLQKEFTFGINIGF
jgi:hypothetical protein